MDAECLDVKELKSNYKVLVARKDIAKGTFLGDIWGKISSSPSKHSWQIGPNKHVDLVGNTKYTEHSCSPNAEPVYNRREGVEESRKKLGEEVAWYLVASRDILKGEVVSYDYTLTDYTMVDSFDCHCGSKNCLGAVQGFKYLSDEEKLKRIGKVSPVIKQLYETS